RSSKTSTLSSGAEYAGGAATCPWDRPGHCGWRVDTTTESTTPAPPLAAPAPACLRRPPPGRLSVPARPAPPPPRPLRRRATDAPGFLRRPLQGLLSVPAGPGPPQPRPVWFEATDDGTIELFTDRNAPNVGALRRDPHASIVDPRPVGEREHWVSLAGTTTTT